MTVSSLASLAGGREASCSCGSSGAFPFLPLAFLAVLLGQVHSELVQHVLSVALGLSGDQGGKKVRRQERRGQETKEASRQGVLSRRRLVQGEANVWPRLLFFGAKSLRCFVCCIS